MFKKIAPWVLAVGLLGAFVGRLILNGSHHLYNFGPFFLETTQRHISGKELLFEGVVFVGFALFIILNRNNLFD